jgi:hypothetical protein
MIHENNNDLFLAIGRLEGKVDALIALQQHQQEQIKEHDSRIRSLEHSRGYILGWSACIGSITTLIITTIIKFF